jgi:hypothetical protein
MLYFYPLRYTDTHRVTRLVYLSADIKKPRQGDVRSGEGEQVQARVIPNLDPVSIENNGERLFYQAAAELPADYTVFYSYIE